MKIVLADDEPLARSRLRRLLAELPTCELLGEAANGEALIELVELHKPDIALVDIHMPGMDGLHAARILSQLALPPAIIFTTAYSEHALSAFGAQASGYLLKPIKLEQLKRAIHNAQQPNQAQVLTGPPVDETLSGFIDVRERDRLIRVPLSDVIYCQAEDKYTRLICRGGKHLIAPSLRQLEQTYPDAFFRVHRKVLVAPNAIVGIEKQAGSLQLMLKNCEDRPPVSRRLAAAVRALIKA